MCKLSSSRAHQLPAGPVQVDGPRVGAGELKRVLNIATVEAVAEFAPGADPDPKAPIFLGAWELGQLSIEQLPAALACELISSGHDSQCGLFLSCHG